jgi:hypothetical protein
MNVVRINANLFEYETILFFDFSTDDMERLLAVKTTKDRFLYFTGATK